MISDTSIIFLAPKELKDSLLDFSKKNDRTYGHVCRKALEKYLEEQQHEQ